MWKYLTLFLITFYVDIFAEEENSRAGKLLPIFQVVRFPNDVCTGATRNGTCFTAEECSSKGGVNDGACASGFGVCCVIKLGCGGTTSSNSSYIVQSSVTTLASPCNYKVCPCGTDICRIRYDFSSFTLASQVLFTALAAGGGAPSIITQSAIGDCISDQFSITSPSHAGSPVICGVNSGYHMILDSNGQDCQTVNFNIGDSTTTTRSWDIYITQYTCAQEDEAGPPGCLQYFTGITGLAKTFAYNPANTAAATDAATTHLQNQDYTICIRREKGYCAICWAPWHTSNSFGLSVTFPAATTAAKSVVGSNCIADYILIPQGTTEAIATTTTPAEARDRFCGRFLNPATDAAIEVSVCSRALPFTLSVFTDDGEVCTDMADAKAQECEAGELPGGILGFALGYEQKAC